MNLEQLQKALSPVTCPACNKGQLSAILRCDLDPKECVAKASCNTCQNVFHLSEGGANDTLAVCHVDDMTCTLVPAES